VIVDRVFNGISPLYCFVMGLLKVQDYLGLRYERGISEDASVFDLELCGENLIFLAGHAAVWLVLLFIIDMWPELKGMLCFACVRTAPQDNRTYIPINEESEDSRALDLEEGEEDEDDRIVKEDVDVYNERMRVLSDKASSDSLEVINLCQLFKVSETLPPISLGTPPNILSV